MGIVHIDAAKVFRLDKRLEYRALFEEWAHIVKPFLAIVEADRQCEVIVGFNPDNPLFAGGEVFRRLAIKALGEIVFYRLLC